MSTLPLPVTHPSYSTLLSHHRDFLSSIASPVSFTTSLLAASSGSHPFVPPTFLYPHLYAASAPNGPPQLQPLYLSSGDLKTFDMLGSRSGGRAESQPSLPPPSQQLQLQSSVLHSHPPHLPPPSTPPSHPRVERPVPISLTGVHLALERPSSRSLAVSDGSSSESASKRESLMSSSASSLASRVLTSSHSYLRHQCPKSPPVCSSSTPSSLSKKDENSSSPSSSQSKSSATNEKRDPEHVTVWRPY